MGRRFGRARIVNANKVRRFPRDRVQILRWCSAALFSFTFLALIVPRDRIKGPAAARATKIKRRTLRSEPRRCRMLQKLGA